MVFVYFTFLIMNNMKATGTRTKNMLMVNIHMQVAQYMKVNGTMIKWKAMVFIPMQMETYTMGLIKTTNSMG